MGSNVYWLFYHYTDKLEGPMTLEEAMKVFRDETSPCLILKTLIDEEGKLLYLTERKAVEVHVRDTKSLLDS